MKKSWLTIAFVAICTYGALYGAEAIGWIRGHRIGYTDGYAASEIGYEKNRVTMAQVGVCRWAERYADCNWKH